MYLNVATFSAQYYWIQETVLNFRIQKCQEFIRMTCRGQSDLSGYKIHMRRLRLEIHYEKRRTSMGLITKATCFESLYSESKTRDK
ncbi:hypothetical protein EVAR_12522_1 [Eumeta japonica]|uniref:Uncharacterized protein n=1 Tax=Eumeta variegata TaxID=151549 RepID=A0A4C1TPQ7_EUMVA|nr:hypothetical protein EVAR_12522_1 [Eumeta japonica]